MYNSGVEEDDITRKHTLGIWDEKLVDMQRFFFLII